MKAPLWKTLDREIRKKMVPTKKKKKKRGKLKCRMCGWEGKKQINNV